LIGRWRHLVVTWSNYLHSTHRTRWPVVNSGLTIWETNMPTQVCFFRLIKSIVRRLLSVN